MKALTRLAIIPALIILVGVACSFSAGDTSSSDTTDASTDQAVSSPTEAVVEAPTEDTSSQDSSSPTSEPYTTFTFDEEPSGWSYWFQSGDEERTSFGVEDGKMNIEINGKQTYLYFTYDDFTYDNVYVETVVENRGVNSQAVSLICRYSEEDGWYEANIQNDGLYNIFVFDARKQPKGDYDMLTSGGSNAIKQGKDVNAYGFSCNDKKLTLWINGTEVTQIKENTYALREGNVGFGVSSFESLPVIVEFDEFTIDKP
jgi:hypothetical protein